MSTSMIAQPADKSADPTLLRFLRQSQGLRIEHVATVAGTQVRYLHAVETGTVTSTKRYVATATAAIAYLIQHGVTECAVPGCDSTMHLPVMEDHHGDKLSEGDPQYHTAARIDGGTWTLTIERHDADTNTWSVYADMSDEFALSPAVMAAFWTSYNDLTEKADLLNNVEVAR